MSKIFIDQVHAENVLQRMWEQTQNEQSCDVVLIAEIDDTRIPAHRSVLSASSDYFRAMFAPSFAESVSKEVKLSSDGEILKQTIKFCYTGRVEVNEDIVENLLKIADLFSLQFVVNACANFLAEQLHPTNCLGFAILAERYRCQSLLEQSKDYCLHHFMEVNKTDEFLHLTAEHLGQLLASDGLRVLSEEDVYNSIITWIGYDPSTREEHKDAMLKLVRMELLKPSFLIDLLKSLSPSFECNQLLKAMEWQILPERRTNNVTISTKLRRSYKVLMAITRSNNKMYIHYYCQQRLKWLKWSKDLEYRIHFGIAVTEHKLYILGGRDAAKNDLNTVICLNLDTMTESQINPMTQHRAGCRAIVLNEFLYAVGGIHAGVTLSSVEKWDPKSNIWSAAASMATPRCDFGIAELNSKCYVLGGEGSGRMKTTECYDPHKNVWNSISPMTDSRLLQEASVANGLLYAVAGYHGNTTVESYNTDTNKWTTLSSLSEKFEKFPVSTTFQDKVIVCYSDRVEEYNPSCNVWEVNTSLKGLTDCIYVFAYSDKLLTSEFTENQYT